MLYKMKWNKWFILITTILSISIVVFNNLTQIINELFKPAINIGLLFGFLIVVIGITTYALINRKILN